MIINLKNLMFPCVGHLNYVLAPPFRDPSLAMRRIIMEETKNKAGIIVMGDFNAASNPQTDRPPRTNRPVLWKPEIDIFNFLEDWAFVDIQKSWEKDEITHTWSNKQTSSRIDYIWLSTKIASKNVHSFENKKAKKIANSDHTLLSLKLYNEGVFNAEKIKIKKKGKKSL